MNLLTEPYLLQQARLPATGQQIIAQFDTGSIIVYQAFRSAIAEYAVAHQRFGGPAYSFQRMTWIKPNFMWMMYRAGWAEKAGQEHILAIRMCLDGFYSIVGQAVASSYIAGQYASHEDWQAALARSDVRVQWDPDHDPYGNKLSRKAIQLGLRGTTLQDFNGQWIMGIQDITQFVLAQKQNRSNGFADLMVPTEHLLPLEAN